MTVAEELIRIIRLRQQRGQMTAELSDANRQVLGRRPQPRQVAAAPVAMPTQAERQTAATRFAQATAAAPVAAAPARPAQPPAQSPQPAAQQRVVLNRWTSQPPQDGPFPPAPDMTCASWEQLQECCLHCACCRLASTRTNVVIEDGCRTAPLMFIGEGPGADEDAQGKPFVGRAGQLLTAMIKAMGRDRTSSDPAKAVYIANVVKCRPPRNRNPFPDEQHACVGFLRRQIALVRPKVIVLLGNIALEGLFGKGGITRARGIWRELDGIPVMPTFHPAYLLRFEAFPQDFVAQKRLVWQDLQQVMAKLQEG